MFGNWEYNGEEIESLINYAQCSHHKMEGEDNMFDIVQIKKKKKKALRVIRILDLPKFSCLLVSCT